VGAFLKEPVTSGGALEVLGLIGTKEDTALITPFLERLGGGPDIFGNDLREQALHTLLGLGDCTALPVVRRLVFDPRTNLSMTAVLDGIEYLNECDNKIYLSKLEPILVNRVTNSSEGYSKYMLSRAIESFHAGYGQAALPALQRIFTGWPPEAAKVEALRCVREPELLDQLRPLLSPNTLPIIRAMAAQALSLSGELDGIIPAAEIAADPGQDTTTRARAVDTFFWFRGPGIRRLLMRVLKTTNMDQADVRSAAYRALSWYDDDETLAVLGGGLEERDDSVRTAALQSFAFAKSNRSDRWLRQNIGHMSPQAKIYAARALQLMKAAVEGEFFTSYIKEQAEKSSDYSALVAAIIGLRE
jgi:HEAT repeat protein